MSDHASGLGSDPSTQCTSCPKSRHNLVVCVAVRTGEDRVCLDDVFCDGKLRNLAFPILLEILLVVRAEEVEESHIDRMLGVQNWGTSTSGTLYINAALVIEHHIATNVHTSRRYSSARESI